MASSGVFMGIPATTGCLVRSRSHLNPLTYQVDALRGIMLVNGSSIYGLGLDCAILLLTLIGLTFLCGRLYPLVVM
ncbi:hypothetical protein ASL19_12100 [Cylindrospermopsis sp. CR12]|nr:hypothetical protein ASL19_12100 [Cylindrospermopsis sp. CR12]